MGVDGELLLAIPGVRVSKDYSAFNCLESIDTRRTESWYRGRFRGDSVAVKNWLLRPQSDTRRWQ
jgi:hypothetical protein